MKWLVAFDISDDKIRRKISALLLKYGCRIQYSIFEIEIPFKKVNDLYWDCSQLLNKGDRLLFIPQTDNDCKGRIYLGNRKFFRWMIV